MATRRRKAHLTRKMIPANLRALIPADVDEADLPLALALVAGAREAGYAEGFEAGRRVRGAVPHQSASEDEEDGYEPARKGKESSTPAQAEKEQIHIDQAASWVEELLDFAARMAPGVTRENLQKALLSDKDISGWIEAFRGGGDTPGMGAIEGRILAVLKKRSWVNAAADDDGD